MKKKAHKLSYSPDFNFILYGISSHQNDYRLIWSVNTELSMNFSRKENLIIKDEKLGEDLEFAMYTCHDENREMKYGIVANRCEKGYLIPELKNIDYLLHLTGEIDEMFQKKLLSDLRNIKSIAAVFLLNVEELKSKKRLVF